MTGELTTVEAVFTPQGDVTPRRFEWHGHMLSVEGVGRRWREADERCFNVMAMGGRVFQLRLDERTLRWSVARGPVPGFAV